MLSICTVVKMYTKKGLTMDNIAALLKVSIGTVWRTLKIVGTPSRLPGPKLQPRCKVDCGFCGSKLLRTERRVRSCKVLFCNKICRARYFGKKWEGSGSPNWVGGSYNTRGPNFRRQAAKARKRDGHRCTRCNVHQSKLVRKLDVHHIEPFNRVKHLEDPMYYKRANKLSNLRTLCNPCHKKVHREMKRAAGIIVLKKRSRKK